MFLSLIILAFVSLSGCTTLNDIFYGPTPTAAPVVTIMPTPVPTATPVPTPVTPTQSSDVKLFPSYSAPFVKFDFIKDVDGQQENVTVVVENDASYPVKNVVLTLQVYDGFGGNKVYEQDFNVGDVGVGGRDMYTMLTKKHAYASSVRLVVAIKWGKDLEFYNNQLYINKVYTVWR